jgi:AcrR family transcriptional regulator
MTRVARSPSLGPKPAPRPRRGQPEETRARLVQAAAEVFNRDGYEGTDSNRIAREAGYSPATFYKHFEDKRELFLLVYKEWVAREWREISAQVAASGSPTDRATQIVRMFLEHHRRWRGFRASLRRLVSSDAEVRSFYRAQRRLQLEMLARMRATLGSKGSRAADALLLYTMERTADAFADGEPEALKVNPDDLEALLVELVAVRLQART